MDDMSLYCISAAAVLLVGVVIAIRQFITYFSPDRSQLWKEIAKPLGWTYDPKKDRISGAYRGRELSLDRIGPTKTTAGLIGLAIGSRSEDMDTIAEYAASRLRLRALIENPKGNYMSLMTAGRSSVVEQAISNRVITGVGEIDEKLQVESNPQEFAPALLQREDLRIRLLELVETYPFSLAIKGTKLNLQIANLEPSKEVIPPILELAFDIAEEAERISK
jgi:hypothetical protein